MLRRRAGRVTDVATPSEKKSDNNVNKNIPLVCLFVLLVMGAVYIYHNNSQNVILVEEDAKIEPLLASEKTEASKTEETPAIEDDTDITFTPEDKCEWRDDFLVGRCHGLWKMKDKKIETAQECSKHCCEDDECQSWQFEKKKGCFVGDIVRLGSERAPTGNWCEPIAPSPWSGTRVLNREGDQCTFSEKEEPYQCYGLGTKQKAETKEECEKLCCTQTDRCELWQWRDDKGCFTGKSGNCDKDNDVWIGKRKPANF